MDGRELNTHHKTIFAPLPNEFDQKVNEFYEQLEANRPEGYSISILHDYTATMHGIYGFFDYHLVDLNDIELYDDEEEE